MGQAEAFKTGVKNSRGKFIACIDADLQNDPNDILKLLAYCRKTPHTYATAWRKKRMDSFLRKVISRLYNTIFNSLFGVRLFDVYGKPKVFERELIEMIKIETKEMAWDLELAHKAKKLGYRVINVPVSHRRRKGISKASVAKGIRTTASLLEYRVKTIFSKKKTRNHRLLTPINDNSKFPEFPLT
jgi:glycosyltransferase involved in cell wall biosynthesis